MKKVLSIALALILVVSCYGLDFYRSMALSSDVVLADPDDNKLTVFDSNAYITNDAETHYKNPTIPVTDTDEGIWLGGNSWLGDNLLAQDGVFMGIGGKSARILERNNACITSVEDFEWQFQLVADNANTINTSFVFHVGETANTSSYAARNNLFAVTLFGNSVDETKNCAVSNALVIEYGGNGNNPVLGNMRPFDYNSQVTPWETKDNSYIKLNDDTAEKAINLTKYITVNIKMEGRKITVSTWQTLDKEATLRKLTVNMYTSVYNKFKSGDFAIVSGAGSCNYRIKDMNISVPREIFNTNNYPAPEHSNPSIKTDTDAGLWLENANLSANLNNRGHLYLGSWKTTNGILSRNKIATQSVENFEWTFDYKGTDTSGNGNVRTAFLFHTNENSDLSSYWNRNYAFSFMVWGSNWSYEGTEANSTKTHDAVPNSISLQVPVYSATDENIMGKPRPLNYAVSADNIRVPSKDSYLELGSIDLSKWMTITIRMEGRKITLIVKQGNTQLSKEFTITEKQLLNAPAGDFAIIQGGNQSAYKNMSIKRPEADVNAPKPEEPKDYEDLPPSGVYFTNDFEQNQDGITYNVTPKNPEQSGINQEKNGNKYLIAGHDYSHVNGNDGWSGININKGSKYKDFTLNFDIRLDSELNSNYHQNWHFLLVGFRSQNGVNDSNILQISAGGAAFSVADKANGKDYTNNRIAYAGTDATYTGSFSLPSGNPEAGILPDNKWHRVSLVADGWTYKYYLDGVLMMSVEDAQQSYDYGSIVIMARSITMQIDNVKILSPDAKIEIFEPIESEDYEDLPASGVYYSNNFEQNQDGITYNATPKNPEHSGIKKEKNGNKYLIAGHDYSHVNGNDGWSGINVNKGSKYKDFILNFNIRLDTELNSNYHQNWHFLLVGFRSQNGVNDSNILQISASGAAFSVADKANGKDYTNNRIAYAGTDATYGYTYNLPKGKSEAGLSPDGIWHRVSIVADSWTYKYYLDGVLMMSVEDTQQLYKSGSIVIMGRSLTMEFDNIEILGPNAEIAPFEPKQTETGLLYENTFENEADAERLTIVRGQNYGIVTEGDKKYFHIDYEPDASNAENGPVNITFGPSGIKDFTLTAYVRITKKVSEKWHPIILMGRTKSGGISAQARLFTKGTYINAQSGSDIYEIARSGPAAKNTTSIYPCHDEKAGVSILEWHKVSLVCDDWTYTVYIDGKKIVEGVDEHKLNKWGGFGIRTEGVNLDIDDIRVYGTPYYDLDYTEEAPTGVLYENDFETENLEGLNFVYHDDELTSIKTEENGNKFLRAYPNMRVKEDGKLEVVGNGNLLITLGPPNTMDFQLKFKVRVMSNTNENVCSTIVGIHSKPSNIKYDSVWFNILARGTSVSLKDSKKLLGIDNLIAKTGENRSGGTAYMPSDNRAMGIRPDGKWHDVKVTVKDYTYTVYIDGVKILSTTDKDKTFYKGYTVIGSNGSITDIDNISLTNK